MTLNVTSTGNVTGKYSTAVGAPGTTEEFDLVGSVSGDLISFAVDFGKYGTLTVGVASTPTFRMAERL